MPGIITNKMTMGLFDERNGNSPSQIVHTGECKQGTFKGCRRDKLIEDASQTTNNKQNANAAQTTNNKQNANAEALNATAMRSLINECTQNTNTTIYSTVWRSHELPKKLLKIER